MPRDLTRDHEIPVLSRGFVSTGLGRTENNGSFSVHVPTRGRFGLGRLPPPPCNLQTLYVRSLKPPSFRLPSPAPKNSKTRSFSLRFITPIAVDCSLLSDFGLHPGRKPHNVPITTANLPNPRKAHPPMRQNPGSRLDSPSLAKTLSVNHD